MRRRLPFPGFRNNIMPIVILAALTCAVAGALKAQNSDPIVYSSRYLTMRDGVKIAVDLYLPRNQPADQKLPTLVEQTRYMRAYDIAPQYARFAPGIDSDIKYFVEHGYAYVLLDVRGSGASFGSRVRSTAHVVDSPKTSMRKCSVPYLTRKLRHPGTASIRSGPGISSSTMETISSSSSDGTSPARSPWS